MTMLLYRQSLAIAIGELCNEAIKFTFKEDPPNWDWLYVLPLYHFLSRACEPFASLEYDPEKIQFNVKAWEFDYHRVSKKMTKGYVNDNIF